MNEIFDVDDGTPIHTLRGKHGTGVYRLTDARVSEYDALGAKAYAAEWVPESSQAQSV